MTLRTIALTGFFFVVFFNTKDDAKVEREVSETVTLCFVSAGCKAG